MLRLGCIKNSISCKLCALISCRISQLDEGSAGGGKRQATATHFHLKTCCDKGEGVMGCCLQLTENASRLRAARQQEHAADDESKMISPFARYAQPHFVLLVYSVRLG